jgi:hypothetical protein
MIAMLYEVLFEQDLYICKCVENKEESENYEVLLHCRLDWPRSGPVQTVAFFGDC